MTVTVLLCYSRYLLYKRYCAIFQAMIIFSFIKKFTIMETSKHIYR